MRLIRRIKHGEPAALSALVWFEFCFGPVSEKNVHFVHAVLGGRIVPLDKTIAERAALLFNSAGRKRALRSDCLIAASALLADAELATFNAHDFQAFVRFGLRLISL